MDETGYMMKEFIPAVCLRLIKCSELFSSVVSDRLVAFWSIKIQIIYKLTVAVKIIIAYWVAGWGPDRLCC